MPLTDQTLTDQTLTDQEVHDLVVNWTSRLVLFARRWTNCPEDAVQQAFCNLCALQFRPDDAVAWMFKATRNTAISIRRAEMMRTKRENSTAVTNWFEPDTENRLDGETVTEKLKELPPELGEVVIARIWGGLTFEQIAAATGCSKTTAHRLYNEAVAALQKRLKVNETFDE